jgi:hypothetical protein
MNDYQNMSWVNTFISSFLKKKKKKKVNLIPSKLSI